MCPLSLPQKHLANRIFENGSRGATVSKTLLSGTTITSPQPKSKHKDPRRDRPRRDLPSLCKHCIYVHLTEGGRIKSPLGATGVATIDVTHRLNHLTEGATLDGGFNKGLHDILTLPGSLPNGIKGLIR